MATGKTARECVSKAQGFAEEQIRYYALARYLCGLTETGWTPDFTTIQDFAQLLGREIQP